MTPHEAAQALRLSGCERSVFHDAIDAAFVAALESRCAKDQRGAAVWHPNHGHLTAASNGPPDPFSCDASDACRAACGKLAVHAEMRAVNRHLRTATGFATTGMHVLHLRVVDGRAVTSGPPSCITCSRDMLDAGVRRSGSGTRPAGGSTRPPNSTP